MGVRAHPAPDHTANATGVEGSAPSTDEEAIAGGASRQMGTAPRQIGVKSAAGRRPYWDQTVLLTLAPHPNEVPIAEILHAECGNLGHAYATAVQQFE